MTFFLLSDVLVQLLEIAQVPDAHVSRVSIVSLPIPPYLVCHLVLAANSSYLLISLQIAAITI